MRNKKSIIKITAVLITLSVSIYFGIRFNLIGEINLQGIKDYIYSYGNFAALVFILFFTLRTLFVIFPFSVMVILGGNIFGFTNALVYSMISAFLSASFAFYISRFAGKDFVQKLLKGRMEKLDLKIERHGLKIIFLMRISSIFPFDILNFTAGLSKVKYRDFILGTIIGIAPETFSLSYLGKNLDNPFSSKFYIAIALVILTIAIPFIISKVRGKKLI
ncbi:MAG: TVP38/TMEM64 family protein [Clostridia bacterium]|nr:TVP38/TMEM64 family protein [Clostridia bacterium]